MLASSHCVSLRFLADSALRAVCWLRSEGAGREVGSSGAERDKLLFRERVEDCCLDGGGEEGFDDVTTGILSGFLQYVSNLISCSNIRGEVLTTHDNKQQRAKKKYSENNL